MVKLSVHVDECIGSIEIKIKTKTNDGGVERESEVGVVEKGGSFEKRREEVTIRGNGKRAHGVEGRDRVVELAMRSVAFDEGRPCWRWGRRKGTEEEERGV